MVKNNTMAALAVGFIGPLVEAFLAKFPEDWTATRLGKVSVGDSHRIHELRAGAQLRAATAQKIIAVIDGHAPGFSERFVKRHARENVYED